MGRDPSTMASLERALSRRRAEAGAKSGSSAAVGRPIWKVALRGALLGGDLFFLFAALDYLTSTDHGLTVFLVCATLAACFGVGRSMPGERDCEISREEGVALPCRRHTDHIRYRVLVLCFRMVYGPGSGPVNPRGDGGSRRGPGDFWRLLIPVAAGVIPGVSALATGRRIRVLCKAE